MGKHDMNRTRSLKWKKRLKKFKTLERVPCCGICFVLGNTFLSCNCHLIEILMEKLDRNSLI